MNNNTNANGATFDPYLTWLGIRDPQRPPNHYRLLGLEQFENDPEVIVSAADRQMTYVRTYQAGQQGEHSQRLLTELTTAKLCLLKPERKRDYDNRLQAAQKPAPLPPAQPPQVRPFATAMPPVSPAAPYPMQPRPLQAAYAQPIPQAAPGEVYQDNHSPYGSPPVSMRASSARTAPNNSVMQWSIVGGLVLATVVLVVILANKFSSPETPPLANNASPPKATPIAAKNPATTPSAVTPAETNGPTQPGTEITEPKNPVVGNEPANSGKSPEMDPTKQRPGPVKAPLPNVALPGIEEPSSPLPSPMNPMPVNPAPMNPPPAVTPSNPAVPATTVPATTVPATAAPPAVAITNNDPLNSLPTSSGNSPTVPLPPANPLNPTVPANPMSMPNPPAMPNPLDANPLGVNPPNGEMTKPAAPRRPLPSVKEIAENRNNLRTVLKDEFAQRDVNSKNSLGKRLVVMARESADKPAMMYVAYDEARNISSEVNDLETAFSAHEELIREFALDQDKDLLETLKVVAKSSGTMSPETAGSVLDIIHESVIAAISDQRLDLAEQLLRFVSNFSPRVPDKATREVGFRDLQKKVAEHKAFAIKNKEYKETLAKNPSDLDANLELGKFWAFQQGNFEKGLSYLAKGSDPEIREAANRELTIKPDSPEFVKVADAWWEAANKLPPEPRSTVKVHAAYTYAQALPTLKALDRGLAESRINEAYKSFRPNNREVKELIKLLLTRVNWKMDWKSKSPLEPVLTFKTTGICDSYEYPTWKLLDTYYVVCFRDRSNPDRSGSPFANRFRRGQSGNNNNNNSNNFDNNSSKPLDPTKNVMKISVFANRIEVDVLNNDGELRGKGTGIPE